MTTERTAAQPAAPSLTPLTDAFCKRYESDMSMPEDSIEKFARSLEALVHQQHEALEVCEQILKIMDTIRHLHPDFPARDKTQSALAAYAALKKESEHG